MIEDRKLEMCKESDTMQEIGWDTDRLSVRIRKRIGRRQEWIIRCW